MPKSLVSDSLLWTGSHSLGADSREGPEGREVDREALGSTISRAASTAASSALEKEQPRGSGEEPQKGASPRRRREEGQERREAGLANLAEMPPQRQRGQWPQWPLGLKSEPLLQAFDPRHVAKPSVSHFAPLEAEATKRPHSTRLP